MSEQKYDAALRMQITELEQERSSLYGKKLPSYSLNEIEQLVQKRRTSQIPSLDKEGINILDSIIALSKSQVDVHNAIQDIVNERGTLLLKELRSLEAHNIPSWHIREQVYFTKPQFGVF